MIHNLLGENPLLDRQEAFYNVLIRTLNGHGVPIGVAVDGANRHDMKLVERTIASIPVEHPDPFVFSQNLLLHKGYDYNYVERRFTTWATPTTSAVFAKTASHQEEMSDKTSSRSQSTEQGGR